MICHIGQSFSAIVRSLNAIRWYVRQNMSALHLVVLKIADVLELMMVKIVCEFESPYLMR